MALLSFAASPSLDILGLLQLGQETHRLGRGGGETVEGGGGGGYIQLRIKCDI